MAKAPTRTKEEAQIDAQVNEGGPAAPTPLERMASLTQRVLAVSKDEAVRQKPKKRKTGKR